MEGLTRDKELEAEAMQTAMMTGCGSVLWMAPEILVADKYVPSFSLARAEIEKSSIFRNTLQPLLKQPV